MLAERLAYLAELRGSVPDKIGEARAQKLLEKQHTRGRPDGEWKMQLCCICDKRGKRNCRECMESYYNHMHDPDTGAALLMECVQH